MTTRKHALESVIRFRLGALTEQQLEVVDRETTRMVVDAVEPEPSEAKWRPEDAK